jgi:hypothetical protein
MSDGISQYGAKGAAIANTAKALHAQRLLTDGEFKELTNSTFSQRDFQAANAAIERAKAIPGISEAFTSARQMNSDLVSLRGQMKPDPADPQMGLGNALRNLFKVMVQ